MKVVIPAPQLESIEGEEDPVVPAPASQAHGGVEVARNRLKRAFELGLFKRAIVVGVPYLHDIGQQVDPHNWGIVVEVQAYRPHPYQVSWADGKTSWHSETELKPIYKGMSEDNCRELLVSRLSVHH